MSADSNLRAEALDRSTIYSDVLRRISALLDGENDWVAAMATVVAELHQSFEHFDWTGFYRAAGSNMLIIGPYQGGHGCLRIPYERGVCGAAAREGKTQIVPDVQIFPGHIACSSTTRSEIVVPVFSPEDKLMAVLDVDSDTVDAFNDIDKEFLERLCHELGRQFGDSWSA